MRDNAADGDVWVGTPIDENGVPFDLEKIKRESLARERQPNREERRKALRLPPARAKPTSGQLAACVGKIAYDSQHRAHETVRRQQKRGYAVRAYRCGLCSMWHVGRIK